jgi:predicted GH43/DUF377 family glycosyl hydrolase
MFRVIFASGVSIISLIYFLPSVAQTTSYAFPCDQPGWFPTGYGLKDHTIFWYDNYYYVMANYIPGETFFAYGRSMDMCNWENLNPVLDVRIPGNWDEMAVWSPFVYEEAGLYYVFYTGVTSDFTQSILMATTLTPDDPTSWQQQGLVFQPNHARMIWQAGAWADCRDPMVLHVDGVYYMYYTGLDENGWIIGVATASQPYGPWQDWGSVIPPETSGMLESATVVRYGKFYYLFYNHSGQGEYYRVGGSSGGPWLDPIHFHPGWAHEIWVAPTGEWYTSYLTNYSVYISPLTWDTFYDPPHPVIGAGAYHILLPVLVATITPP